MINMPASSILFNREYLKRYSYAKKQYKKRLLKYTKYAYYYIDTTTKTLYYSFSKDAIVSYLGIPDNMISKSKYENDNFQLLLKVYNSYRIDYVTIDRRTPKIEFFRAKDVFSYLYAILLAKIQFAKPETVIVKYTKHAYRFYHKSQLLLEFTIDRTINRKYTFTVIRNPFNLKF